MNDLRKAAEMALEGLETLWDILDDIDTASDMAKENDAWYRKRVEALQKKRWDTMITTDGYKLKGGPVEALRQALDLQTAIEKGTKAWSDVSETVSQWVDELRGNVDAVDMSEERVHKTDKSINEPEGWVKIDEVRQYLDSVGCGTIYKTAGEDRIPLYAAPPKRGWVGLTDEEIQAERHKLDPTSGWTYDNFARAIEAKLKEKNGG